MTRGRFATRSPWPFFPAIERRVRLTQRYLMSVWLYAASPTCGCGPMNGVSARQGRGLMSYVGGLK